MSVELVWKHQQKAYELMKKSLKENKKAAYIFPTGCGKTFPVLKYIEENPEKRVLLVSPSQGINNQFRKYVNRYVENGENRLRNKNIRIQTYQKKAFERKRDIKGIESIEDKKFTEQAPDIIIFDEIHRMGAETWEVAIDELMRRYPNAEVIGMTATPERTDKRNMAYEKFGDNVVYEMSLTEALSGEKEGEVVLQTPRYVRVLSELKGQLEEYREQIELIEDEEKRIRLQRKFEKLDTIVSNSPDIEDIMVAGMQKKNGKYIVFCKDREDMLDKMNRTQEIFGKVNQNIHTEYVLSKNEAGDTIGKTNVQNREALENFENKENGEELNLLFCVDKLNEGVHIEGIDGEVLFDLTESEILYKQRIGRVLSSDKEAGEAVIIDVANNWLNQIEVYKELEYSIQRGGTIGNKDISYDSLKLTPEETDLLEIMKEINEELTYNNYQTYEEIIEWLEINDGKLPRKAISEDGKQLRVDDMTVPEKQEIRLRQRWDRSLERKVLEEYAGEPIESVPEEYREKIATLRSYGLGEKVKTAYEEIIEWLETYDGKMPRSTIKENGKRLTVEEMTNEERQERNLYVNWSESKEKKVLDEYVEMSIAEVPEEYREKIAKLRSYGLGTTKRNSSRMLYEEIIEWLETHDGKIPSGTIKENGKKLTVEEMTKEEQDEVNLYGRWKTSNEKKILQEYAGEPIESVPEEYREKIATLRSYGLGEKVKTAYEEIIEWLETHDGKMPRSTIKENGKKLTVKEMTNEQHEERTIYGNWIASKEKNMLYEYTGRLIEEVPEEYREKIATLRSYGLGKTTYEEIIEWLETHDGNMPRSRIKRDKKEVKADQMTPEENEEFNLYVSWGRTKEKKILDEYAGRVIEEVPEEYREKIARLRELIQGKQTVYEEIIEWLETHDGKLPQTHITKDGKRLGVKEMTKEQHEGKKLYAKWGRAKEKEILDEYAGRVIEEVPEEYREKIAKLRSLGQLGQKKDDKIKSKMKKAVSSSVENNIETRKELETEREQNLKNDGYHGFLDD